MLPYLSRVSLWLAALAAAASLFTPGRHGAMLASVAMVSLIGALVMRRFALRSAAPATLEPDETRPLDDAAMLDVAAVLTRSVAQAASLADALADVREELIHELGAHGVIVHGPCDGAEPLVLANRFPLNHAQATGEVAGSP